VLQARQTGDVRLRAPDPAAARSILEAAGYTVTGLPDAWRVHGVTDPAAVTRALADRGHYLTELAPISADLETAFLELTRETA
jgi:ABC-2 type transport system ATP-binding protein